LRTSDAFSAVVAHADRSGGLCSRLTANGPAIFGGSVFLAARRKIGVSAGTALMSGRTQGRERIPYPEKKRNNTSGIFTGSVFPARRSRASRGDGQTD
jgi:hypothetical protein